LGITAKTKGKTPIEISLNIKRTLSINNDGATTERNYTNGLSGRLKYHHKGGLTLPIFFFRDFDISNDVTLQLNLSYDNNFREERYTFEGDFVETQRDKSISIKPEIQYSFTRYVTGGIHFNYSMHEDLNNGTRTEKDFGFNVHIKIRG
jgi:hypothetical protein